MNLKNRFVFLLVIVLFLPVFCMTASSSETPEFHYELTVDGKDTVEVSHGDLITVNLYLYRTDTDDAYSIISMQDEIRYDSSFFELVEDSIHLAPNVISKDITIAEDIHELYMTCLFFGGGEQWKAKTWVGSFQLRVKGTTGVTTLTNEDPSVFLLGSGSSNHCSGNVLTVYLSSYCTVRFETNGGSPIESVSAFVGDQLIRPADPVREGKVFAGWYRDIRQTQEWDFDHDRVEQNMTLYAKWIDVEHPTDEPTTDEPMTDEPTTDEPTTDEPTTDEPTTDEPTTDEPTTDEPTTDEPTTDEPTTDEPTTDEPTTDEPTTDEPTTDEPSTDEPTTDEPTTDEPTTDEPTTDEPTTDEPTTDEPTTDEPATDEPTTDEPTEPPQENSCPLCGKQHSAKMPGAPLCLISWLIVAVLSLIASILILWLWMRAQKET